MKILQTHHKLLFFSAATLFIVGFVLLIFFMPQINATYHVYWLLLLAILIIIFSPIGNKKLALNDEKPRYSWPHWLIRIFSLELAVFAIFFGVTQLSGITLPIFTEPSALLAPSLHYTLLNLGLFPWAEIAFLACMLGYHSYHQRQDAYLSTLFQPLFRTQVDNTLGMMINASARAATLFTLSSAIALTALLLVSLFFSSAHIAMLSGFNILNIFACAVLLIFALNKVIKKPIYWLTIKQGLHPFTALFFIMLLLVALLVVLNLFFNSNYNSAPHIPYLMQLLLKRPWKTQWNLFITLWWLAWIPPLAIMIARFSLGYSYRNIILATLAFPVLISIGLLWHPLYRIINATCHLSPLTITGITLAGFSLLVIMTVRKEMFDSTIQSYLPQPNNIKFRNSDRFLGNVLQFSAFTLCIYLTTGIFLLNVIFFMFLLIFSIILIFLPLAFLLKKR